mmetsp:Transcript_75627/g.225431  ORF Transcript_75627/g.225431 Transcript_75627/m.225431 type:complete len:267 (+) Transcript_75627:450-1250(+)
MRSFTGSLSGEGDACGSRCGGCSGAAGGGCAPGSAPPSCRIANVRRAPPAAVRHSAGTAVAKPMAAAATRTCCVRRWCLQFAVCRHSSSWRAELASTISAKRCSSSSPSCPRASIAASQERPRSSTWVWNIPRWLTRCASSALSSSLVRARASGLRGKINRKVHRRVSVMSPIARSREARCSSFWWRIVRQMAVSSFSSASRMSGVALLVMPLVSWSKRRNSGATADSSSCRTSGCHGGPCPGTLALYSAANLSAVIFRRAFTTRA